MSQSDQKKQQKQAIYRNDQANNDRHKQTMLDNLKRDFKQLGSQLFETIYGQSTPEKVHKANIRGLRSIAGNNAARQNSVLNSLVKQPKQDEHIYAEDKGPGIIDTKTIVECYNHRGSTIVTNTVEDLSHEHISSYLKPQGFFEVSHDLAQPYSTPEYIEKKGHFKPPDAYKCLFNLQANLFDLDDQSNITHGLQSVFDDIAKDINQLYTQDNSFRWDMLTGGGTALVIAFTIIVCAYKNCKTNNKKPRNNNPKTNDAELRDYFEPCTWTYSETRDRVEERWQGNASTLDTNSIPATSQSPFTLYTPPSKNPTGSQKNKPETIDEAAYESDSDDNNDFAYQALDDGGAAASSSRPKSTFPRKFDQSN